MKAKNLFFCTECGYETAKWLGKCPSCGAWNTIVEQPKPISKRSGSVPSKLSAPETETLSQIQYSDESRYSCGSSEVDRVLGGGMVPGSLILVGGEPGIGKSTLLLQICGSISETKKVLYVTGEESKSQLKLRANRLHVDSENVFVLAETNLSVILSVIDELRPEVVVIDSIQTVYQEEVNTAPGNVAQVKECTMTLMNLAKGSNITVIVIGHVNKEGAIAGPKVLEHMVDCVLYFEGDRQLSYRILRAAKNRFGSTNEIGVFDMSSSGLVEVKNPSALFLTEHYDTVPGTSVVCMMEGSRPMLVEIQALISKSAFSVPRRVVDGVDFNRTMLLLAVLEKRTGLFLGGFDVYVNVVGGFQINETASDLPILLAIASCVKETAIPRGMFSLGEVGLTGEIRAVSSLNQRILEAHRLGFNKCLIPKQKYDPSQIPEGMELIPVSSLKEALAQIYYLN